MAFNMSGYRYHIVLSLFLMTGMVSCAKNSVLVDNYVKDAILLNISAAVDLNYYNDQSHPILLAIFELSDPSEFKQILANKDKIAVLLESSSNLVGVVSQLKITLHPGHNKTVLIDKVEKARYLGIIAGFFSLENHDNYVRLYEIDVYEEKTIFGSSTGVQKLSIDIELGRNGFGRHEVVSLIVSHKYLEQILMVC